MRASGERIVDAMPDQLGPAGGRIVVFAVDAGEQLLGDGCPFF